MSPVTKSAARAGNSLGVWLYRKSSGKIAGGARGLPVLVLTVSGRSTGLPHSTCVSYFTYGDGYLVVGSGGGSHRDPDWFRNLRRARAATVQMGSEVRQMTAVELKGTQRDEVYRDVVLAKAPFFAKYVEKGHREMPIAQLTPLSL